MGLDLRRLSDEQRRKIGTGFWERVHKNYDGSSCWRFGPTRPYPAWRSGVVWWEGQTLSATYFSYALHHGRIERGMFLWRACGIANCVNPAHLMYRPYLAMQEWFANRPRLAPAQVQEARHLYFDQGTNIYQLCERYGLMDQEMRQVLNA